MAQSPYLARLTLAIDGATDSIALGMARAERAACHARHGEFELTETEIADLRSVFGDGRSGRVSIMIMCAEAQLIYFKSLGEQARDRMMRAQLLSVAGRDAALSSLTSAWLAHICFNLHRHGELVRCAKTCLDTLTPRDHEATARLSLTLGDAFLASEQFDIGARWYAKAHEHAVKLGDHSTIGALTYNRAAMGTFMARVRSVNSVVDAEMVSRLSSEVRTAINYQAIAQLASLQGLLDYSLASANILAARFAEALTLLSNLVEVNASTSPLDRMVALRCDLALCFAKANRCDEATAVIETLPWSSILDCTPDDQVVAFAALRDASRLCGLGAVAEEAEAKLAVALDDHERAVASLREGLSEFGDISIVQRL